MYKKSNIISRLIAIACISVFALTSVPLVNDTYARDRDGRGGKFSREYRKHDRHDRKTGRFERAFRRHNRHERREARFERAFRRHERKAFRSFRHDRWRDNRHAIARPFVRHRHAIKRLPWGYKRFWHNRRPYFFSRGIFYRPYSGGFFAVRAPVGAIVLSLPIGYERLWVDDTTYYVYGGTYYQRVPSGYVVVDPPATVVVEDSTPETVPPAMSASGQVVVDAPVLNVRSGPSLDDERIYQFEEGAILEVNGKSDGWLYVLLPNGEHGWVKSVFTKPVTPGTG